MLIFSCRSSRAVIVSVKLTFLIMTKNKGYYYNVAKE